MRTLTFCIIPTRINCYAHNIISLDNYRFSETQVKTAMEKFVKDTLSGTKFDSDNVAKWSKEISHNIKSFLKSCNWTRYKFMVQVVIGERNGQGVKYVTLRLFV